MANPPTWSMEPGVARKVVLASTAASGVAVVLSRATTGQWPQGRVFLGLAFVFVVLGFGADIVPQIAGPGALLVGIAIIIAVGGGVFGSIATVTGGTSSANRQHPGGRIPPGARGWPIQWQQAQPIGG